MFCLSWSWWGCALVGVLVAGCSSGGAGRGGSGGSGAADPFPCTAEGLSNAIAEGGGPHRFDCNGPTTVMPGVQLVVEKDVILDGEGQLTIDGEASHPLLWVKEGITAELLGLEFRRGANGAIANNGTLIMVDTTVSESEGLIFNNGVLEMTGCTAELGFGTLYGAIYNDGGTLTVVDSIVHSTEALHEGGGIYNTGVATIVNSELLGNFGWDRGGAVSNAGEIEIRGCSIKTNWSWGDSGALYNHRGAKMTISNTTVSINDTGVKDGATIFNAGEMSVIGTTISDNAGQDYDGVRFDVASLHNDRGTLTLRSTVVNGYCSSTMTSEGNNIESPGDTCGLDQETDQVNVDAGDLPLSSIRD